MLSSGPKWVIVRGSPGRGLKIAIFWVSACSVVRRAFLEPSKSISCKSGLPPALPAPVGEARQPGKWPSCPSGRLGKSGSGPPSGKGASPRVVECCQVAPKWVIVRGSPGRGLQIAIFWVFAWSRGHFSSRAEALRVKAAFLLLSPCGRLGKSGPGPPSHASSNAVRWPEMAHREGVPRTRPQNRDFLGFCMVCGAECISRA